MARRELRASRRRFALYGSCMALGIAALVGLHGLRATVRDAVDAQSRQLLGADLRLASRAPLDASLEARVSRLTDLEGSAAARITRFGSMALATRSGRTRLVDVQAVADGYPFYGAVRTEPPGLWAQLQGADHAALVDRSLLVQLDARVGDALTLGEARFRVAGTITRAPGSFGVRTQVAPRVFIARRYVAETRLVRPGSLVDHLVYLRAAEEPLRRWLGAHGTTLAGARVRVQTVASYQKELTRSFGVLTRYLGLVGLAALALGGVGVAAGVRVFVREKLDTVAVLRALGAGSGDVLAAYGLLAVALGASAGVAGADRADGDRDRHRARPVADGDLRRRPAPRPGTGAPAARAATRLRRRAVLAPGSDRARRRAGGDPARGVGVAGTEPAGGPRLRGGTRRRARPARGDGGRGGGGAPAPPAAPRPLLASTGHRQPVPAPQSHRRHRSRRRLRALPRLHTPDRPRERVAPDRARHATRPS
jgi:hypothetical protein